jgi:chemotaxis signal transduction protein
MTDSQAAESRLFSFEVAGGLFAIPITEILEVSESSGIASIPTVDRSRGGVVNYRGDALPVVSLPVLLGSDVPLEAAEGGATELAGRHLLVLTRGNDPAPRLGLPIDSVRGLISAPSDSKEGEGVVRERFSLEDREILVIDSRQLMARATSVIEGRGADVRPNTGGGYEGSSPDSRRRVVHASDDPRDHRRRGVRGRW